MILVQVSVRFELSRVQVIGMQLFTLCLLCLTLWCSGIIKKDYPIHVSLHVAIRKVWQTMQRIDILILRVDRSSALTYISQHNNNQWVARGIVFHKLIPWNSSLCLSCVMLYLVFKLSVLYKTLVFEWLMKVGS